jgi:dTDP-4-dehydrorhamnose 3,5-epimerase
VPVGFAHGFCTLEDDTEVLYKVTTYYAAAHDRGIAWDDPALGIPWPVAVADAILSDKDQRQPRLADSPGLFT